MGCCYSNEDYETSHYGYKNLTNEIMNQKKINQSKSEINTARLFMIAPLKPKNANSLKKNTEKKDLINLKPTIYYIQLKTNLSNAAKYSNNVNQSSFIEEENICNCSCANCKKNQVQITERKSSRTANQITERKSSRTATQIKDLNTTRSSQEFIRRDYKQPPKTNISLNLKSKFNIEALDQHNKYRKSHGVPPLELNEYLIKLAQNHSDYLALTYRNVYLKHKYHGHEIGQNIKIYADSKLDSYSGETVTDDWYKQSENYDYKKNESNSLTRFFTQIVWKSTKEVGFGISKANNGSLYMVGFYYPSGNIDEQFKDNVLVNKYKKKN